MKKLTLILCCMTFLSCYAQDKIILKDLSKIEGQVLSLGTSSVLIEVNGEPKGYSANEILTVVLENGTIKTYNEYNPTGEVVESPKEESTVVTPNQNASTVREHDILILKDATRIEASITEVSDTEVHYKKLNTNGPVFVVSMDKISAIMYTSGEIYVNKDSEIHDKNADANSNSNSNVYRSGKGAHFQFNWEVGCVFNREAAGPTMDFILGSRIRDWFFIGYDFGVHTSLNHPKTNYWYVGVVPLSLNMKFYLPVTEKFFPHIDGTVGMHVGHMEFYETKYDTYYDGYSETTYSYTELTKCKVIGLLAKVGLGFEIKKFKLAFGYEYMNGHNGYFNIGCTVPARSQK